MRETKNTPPNTSEGLRGLSWHGSQSYKWRALFSRKSLGKRYLFHVRKSDSVFILPYYQKEKTGARCVCGQGNQRLSKLSAVICCVPMFSFMLYSRAGQGWRRGVGRRREGIHTTSHWEGNNQLLHIISKNEKGIRAKVWVLALC